MKKEDNTQSKVDGEKPDFDQKLAVEILVRFTGSSRGTPIAKQAFIDGAIWANQTYFYPLHSRIKELGELCESRRKDMELYTSEFFRVRDENFALKHRLKELESSQSWVSVSERLPEVGINVWISTEYYQSEGTYLGSDQYGIKFREGWQFPRYNFVTHWRPLPSKPENK